MKRRALAMMMLLVATASFASQGLALVLCRCSGDVFLGHAPDACCEECPVTAPMTAPALMDSDDTAACVSCSECFVSMSKGWDTYAPSVGKSEVPTPSFAAVQQASEPACMEGLWRMDAVRAGTVFRKAGVPPGHALRLLYSPLRI